MGEMDVIRHLVEIGPRLSGTQGEKEAARYLASKFREIGLEVETYKYRFLGWDLLENPRLEMLSPERKEIPCAPNIYSSSTPDGGAEGTLRYIGKVRRGLRSDDRYAIINKDGEEAAYIIGTDQPVPRNGIRDLRFPMPEVNVASDIKKMLARLMLEGVPVRMKLILKTRFNPEASAYNVIATLRGRDHPERIIIMTAHLDTQINTVGANDDASGISVLFQIAKRLSETGSSKTIKFCIFGGEEYGMYGSRHYENRLKETGELSKVEFVMCFDEVGRKKQTHKFRATDEWLRLKLEKALKELKAKEHLGEGLIEEFPMRWVRRAFGSDHAPFVEDGVPAISIGGGGYDGYSHTGSSGDQDTLEGISLQVIAYKADIGLRLLKYMGATKNDET
jgi:hypothetical protein